MVPTFSKAYMDELCAWRSQMQPIPEEEIEFIDRKFSQFQTSLWFGRLGEANMPRFMSAPTDELFDAFVSVFLPNKVIESADRFNANVYIAVQFNDPCQLGHLCLICPGYGHTHARHNLLTLLTKPVILKVVAEYERRILKDASNDLLHN